MSLAVTPAYDPDAVSQWGDHAVVVGGSVAGLLAARVLDDAFARVTVVERDSYPDEPTPRRSTPQAAHTHVLLDAGRQTLDDLLPGFGDALAAAGAPVVEIGDEFRFHDRGDFLAAPPSDIPLYCVSRPLLEYLLHERVLACDGVESRDGCRVTDYLTDDASTVTGVRLRTRDGAAETLATDLVVDATGRASQTPSWLDDHGYARPPVDDVRVNLAYSTLRLVRPPDDERAVVVAPDPPRARGAALFPVEDDEWILTAFGLHDETPPPTVAGVREWVASLPPESLARVVGDRTVVSDEAAHYPFPSSRRRRYWDLGRVPDGLLVTGDAVASFNPIYGQGMSVAALEACHLSAALAGGRDDLASRFFERIAAVVADAWALAVGSDFRFSATTGPKPRGADLLNRYMTRLVRRAQHDGTVAEVYARVAGMEWRPASVLRPGVAWRVLRPRVGGRG